MKTSDQVNEICAAIVAMQQELEDAPKDKENPHFKNRYSDLATVMQKARPVLAKHGLGLVQFPEADGPKVSVVTRLVHKSGQWMEGVLTMTARDASPQSIGSAVTYGRRYSAPAAIGMATEDDDDANAATAPKQQQQQQRRQQPPKQEATPPPAADKPGVYSGTEEQRNVLRDMFAKYPALETEDKNAIAQGMRGQPMYQLKDRIEARLAEKQNAGVAQ